MIKQIAKIVPLLLCSSAQAAFAQASPSAFTTGHRYDYLGRETGVILPDPDQSGPLAWRATRVSYNGRGLPLKTEVGELAAWQPESVAPSLWTGFTVFQTVEISYDANGRKIQELTRSGSVGATFAVKQFSYDALGRLQCTAVRMDPAQWGSQTNACLPQTTGPNGPDRITKNVYDAAGQPVQVRKALGTGDESADVTSSFTANGKQQYVIDANGNRAQLVYDGFDRQTQWIFPSAVRPGAFNDATQATALSTAGAVNPADYEQYAYDANGNRTSLRKRDGSTLTFAYDATNRVTVKTVPERSGLPATHTRDVYYGYDLQGHQLFARFDSATGEGVSSIWDGFGQQTSSTQTLDGAARTLSYEYDADGNRTRVTFPDGNYATYTYDGIDRPIQILRSGAGLLASYTYDPAGRRTGFNSAITTSYGYDGISRVSSLVNNPVANAGYNNNWSFAYNSASQISSQTRSNDIFAWNGAVNVNRSYTTNGLNQYTAAGTAAFGYDANGNLTTDGTSSFAYDVENRLVDASGAKTASLRYDPMGRLYEVGGSSGTTRFLYDGDALAAEYSTSGVLLRRYVHGADISADDPLAWYEGSGFASANERQMRPDWQNSISVVTDSAGSAIIAANTYDEWGIPGSGNAGRFQYTGQAWLPELGMYHYKARIYSPTLGRFLQTDPIGYKDQYNLYAYVGNDPLNKIDPEGTDSWLVSRPTPYPGAGHMFVVVTDPRNGEVIVRYSFAPNGTTSQSLMFQTNLVSVTGANDNTNKQDANAWSGIQSGKADGATAVRIGASDASVISAGNKVNAATGTLEKPGSLPYTFYGTNSNAAAYAIADLAVKADGGAQGSQAVPGDQYHPGVGAYRQVEATAQMVAQQPTQPQPPAKTCSLRPFDSSPC